MAKKLRIVEATLRDGSYANGFSFTSTETAALCHDLEMAGFEYIEVGHGAGLGASQRGKWKAAESDENYMKAAQSALHKSEFGVFCIAGTAMPEDIELAAKCGAAYVRVGTNVTQVAESEEIVKLAKDLGLAAFSHFMKSYALPAKDFAMNAALAEKFGADAVYIVDSAGSMFPDDIARYYEETRKISSVALGFHGHDNLRMAVSNSLEAARLGFGYVDCALQGFGRSGGNAPTEVLIASLKKKGYEIDVDLDRLLTLAPLHVRPFMDSVRAAPLDVIGGYAGFHSNYLPKVLACARTHSVDPAKLIVRLCEIDKINAEEKTLEEVALCLKKENPSANRQPPFQYGGGFYSSGNSYLMPPAQRFANYIDGRYCGYGESLLPCTDIGLLRGLAVFDFFRTYNGGIAHAHPYLDRLERSAGLIGLGLPMPKESIFGILEALLKKNYAGDELTFRMVVTGGESKDLLMPEGKSRLFILAGRLSLPPADLMKDGIALSTTREERLYPAAKTTNYIPAILPLGSTSAHDVLYLTSDGLLKECTTSNIFVVRQGEILTPRHGMLNGITRGIALHRIQASLPSRQSAKILN